MQTKYSQQRKHSSRGGRRFAGVLLVHNTAVTTVAKGFEVTGEGMFRKLQPKSLLLLLRVTKKFVSPSLGWSSKDSMGGTAGERPSNNQEK